MAAEEKKSSKKQLLEDAIEGIKRCVDREEMERGKMLDDLRFAALDQWPSDIRKEREGDAENGPRPCLTTDQINQYIVQIVNDMRQGRPSIKVRPVDDAADVETAKILQGIIRNIEDQSSAEIAYMTAGESQVKIGLGYFRITTEYAGDDTFDQEIVIKRIPNTFSTYLGEHSMPDGSDAEEGYVIEQMPKAEFEKRYPKAKAEKTHFQDLGDKLTFWRTDESITVMERYYIRKTYEEVLFLEDGRTMARADYDAWPQEAGPKPGIEDTRTKTRKSLHWCKLTGAEILEERDLPGQYIPIVEVVGRETIVEGKRVLWGVVRPAKDSLRMYNYWNSVITEKLALAPKTPFVGAVGQFASQGDRWQKANRVNYALLQYDAIDVNGNAVPPPQRQGATPMEVGMLNQLPLIREDVKAALGMYKSSLGESESQQSGRAILALQRESDTGTYHFGANLGQSIRHAGRIILDMIPHYYDTRRIVRILGEDGEIQAVTIDPQQQESMREITTNDGIKRIYNPSVGKYDVTITVGPSYNTKRMEAAATFVEMSKGAADPASAAVMRYLTVKNSDIAGTEEAARMLKALLPPQVLQQENQPRIPPQAQAQMAQMGQAIQALQAENQELKSGAQVAMAKVDVDAKTKAAQLDADRAEAASRLALERAIAEEKAKLAREIADAEHGLKRDAVARENDLARHKLDLDRENKLATDPNYKDVAMMPQVMDAMAQLGAGINAIAQAVGQMAAMQQQSIAMHQEMLAEMRKPKAVSLGHVQTDASGKVTGATVAVH